MGEVSETSTIRAAVEKQLKSVAIFDNNGKTADRYTAVYLKMPERKGLFNARGMSGEPYGPYHPQGVGMCVSAKPGRHLGTRIRFEDLPEDCKRLVLSDLPELQLYSVEFTDTYGGEANYCWAERFCVEAENIGEAVTKAKKNRYAGKLPKHTKSGYGSDDARIDIVGKCICAFIVWLDREEFNQDYHGELIDA
jgi:hypothetical protein